MHGRRIDSYDIVGGHDGFDKVSQEQVWCQVMILCNAYNICYYLGVLDQCKIGTGRSLLYFFLTLKTCLTECPSPDKRAEISIYSVKVFSASSGFKSKLKMLLSILDFFTTEI